jgi:putative heme-binding domain-containing protein
VQGLPQEPTGQQLAAVRELDRELATSQSPAARELAKANLDVLSRGDARSLEYLHQVFESAPDRRQDVALAVGSLALTRQRRGEDWQLLMRSLSVVEGPVARDVLRALAKFQERGTKPEQLRQVIVIGLKLQDKGGRDAAALLSYWTRKNPAGGQDNVEAVLAAWQKWFTEAYPDQPEPTLPVEPAGDKWTYAQLLEFLSSDKGSQGNTERGAVAFEKSLCIKCHRYGNRGEGIGPDLSTVSSRFQRKEILESVIFPSQVISDQFAAKTVVTKGGQSYTGLVGPAGDDIVVLQSNAEKVTLRKKDLDEIAPSKKSAMPEGLFNTLTLEEIADLFAYLGKPPAK